MVRARLTKRHVVAFALPNQNPVGVAPAQTAPVPPLSDATMERCADDLTLSDAQRDVLVGLVAEYQQHYLEDFYAASEARRTWIQDFWLSVMPELDESVDISELPLEQQDEIIRNRESLRRGFHPVPEITPGQMKKINDHSFEVGNKLLDGEQQHRDHLLASLFDMLAPDQAERWPMAIRRLDINMADQNPSNKHSPDDPRGRVDMLALMLRASEEQAELHPIADALRTPDRVIALELGDATMLDLARTVLAFESGYRNALKEYKRQRDEVSHDYITLFNNGQREEAAKLRKRELRALRSAWDMRIRLVDEIAEYARTIIDEDAAEAWQRRAREQFCPVLYLDDSTDMLHERIMVLDDLESSCRASVEELYRQHCVWRDEFLPRVVQLEIDDRCQFIFGTPEIEGDTRRRLLDAHEERMNRAERIMLQFRALLPTLHRDALDEWWKAWQEDIEHDQRAPTVNVRP